MNKGALIKEIRRFNQDIDRKARNAEALARKGPSFALQAAGAKSELEAICGSYFALIGEYTRKGMIVNMSIDNYVIPDINSKSNIVIGIWNDVISKSTNTENIGEAAEVQSADDADSAIEVVPEVIESVIEEVVIEPAADVQSADDSASVIEAVPEVTEEVIEEAVVEPAADVNLAQSEEIKMTKYTQIDVFSAKEEQAFKEMIATTKQRIMNREVLDNMCDAADEYDAAPDENKDFWKVAFYVRRYIVWHVHLGFKIDNYGVLTQTSESEVINKAAAIILEHLNMSFKDKEEREKVFKTTVENIENANKEGWTHTVKVMFSKGCGMIWDFAKGLFWYVINGVKRIAMSAFECMSFVLVSALNVVDCATSKDFGENSPGLITKMIMKHGKLGRSATEAK